MAQRAGPASLVRWFIDRYSAPPEAVWHAPGRVNFIGEHTDYNDGLVLPFAVGRGVTSAAVARTDGVLEMSSRQMPGQATAVDIGALEPGAMTGWAAYAAGAAWALMTAGVKLTGANIGIDADLPIGAGLSSSAALTCAVMTSLLAATGQEGLSRAEIAALAQRAEAEFVGMPCGIMDQSAAMLSEAGTALLLDCRSGETTLVPLDPMQAGLQILVIDTGVRHALADGRYAERRQQCADAAAQAGVPTLREVTDLHELTALSDPVLLRRAMHVIAENRRVEQVVTLLRAGRLADCGELLTASHVSLRDNFEVSWPAADIAVNAAVAAGALGARMTGGGFGGCVIALAPEAWIEAMSGAVATALAEHSGGQPTFLIVSPAAGAAPAR